MDNGGRIGELEELRTAQQAASLFCVPLFFLFSYSCSCVFPSFVFRLFLYVLSFECTRERRARETRVQTHRTPHTATVMRDAATGYSYSCSFSRLVELSLSLALAFLLLVLRFTPIYLYTLHLHLHVTNKPCVLRPAPVPCTLYLYLHDGIRAVHTDTVPVPIQYAQLHSSVLRVPFVCLCCLLAAGAGVVTAPARSSHSLSLVTVTVAPPVLWPSRFAVSSRVVAPSSSRRRRRPWVGRYLLFYLVVRFRPHVCTTVFSVQCIVCCVYIVCCMCCVLKNVEYYVCGCGVVYGKLIQAQKRPIHRLAAPPKPTAPPTEFSLASHNTYYLVHLIYPYFA